MAVRTAKAIRDERPDVGGQGPAGHPANHGHEELEQAEVEGEPEHVAVGEQRDDEPAAMDTANASMARPTAKPNMAKALIAFLGNDKRAPGRA